MTGPRRLRHRPAANAGAGTGCDAQRREAVSMSAAGGSVAGQGRSRSSPGRGGGPEAESDGSRADPAPARQARQHLSCAGPSDASLPDSRPPDAGSPDGGTGGRFIVAHARPSSSGANIPSPTARQGEPPDERRRRQTARARLNRHRDLERLLHEGHARLPEPAALSRAEATLLRFERRGVRRAALFFVLLVLLPALAAAFHLLLWATPLYRAEARFAVERGVPSAGLALPGLAGALGTADGLKDAFMLRDYILSPAMMQRLDARLGYLDDFRDPRIDPLTRLVTIPALGIDRYRHYRRHVSVTIDVQSGLIGLAVEAPSAARAAEVAGTILELSADELNRLSDAIYRDQMSRMEAERAAAEKALEAARRDLLTLQIRRGELNPRETVAALYARMQEIDGRIDELARQRGVARMAGRPGNPTLRRIEAEIAVLQRQRKILESRLVGGHESGAPLNETLAAFDAAETRLAIARQRWEALLASLEEARRAALADRRYLAVVAPPRAPPFPERLAALRLSLFLFLALLVIYLLGRVFLAALRLRLSPTAIP